MRLSALLSSLFIAALFAVAPSHAYTPESGIWSNPNESGSGYVIEIQDNLMVLAYYGGDAQGRAVWHLASGLLSGNARFDNKQMNRTVGSQCIGCPYLGAPITLVGDGGTVTVVFDPNDNTKATLTWGNGRVVPIRRQWFYFKRGSDPASMRVDATMMLGEWQVVMDFSSNSQSSFDFYGEVLVFNGYEFNNALDTWTYEGCRADNSIDGECSNNALAFHNAIGYYVPSLDAQCIVVTDSPSNFLLYAVQSGTNHLQGEVTVYPANRDPLDYAQYPVRGFRSASRTFVEGDVGPSKAAKPRKGVSDMIAPVLRASADKVALGELTEACLEDEPALKNIEARLKAMPAG